MAIHKAMAKNHELISENMIWVRRYTTTFELTTLAWLYWQRLHIQASSRARQSHGKTSDYSIKANRCKNCEGWRDLAFQWILWVENVIFFGVFIPCTKQLRASICWELELGFCDNAKGFEIMQCGYAFSVSVSWGPNYNQEGNCKNNTEDFYLHGVSEASVVGSSYPCCFLDCFKLKQPLKARILKHNYVQKQAKEVYANLLTNRYPDAFKETINSERDTLKLNKISYAIG